MKRNNLPDDRDHLNDEQKIVSDRLNELFCQSSDRIRRVSVICKGFWLSHERHVKIESIKGISTELVSFSPSLKYHYMKPFEALFSLETSKLLIYFNGFPLSLAEAYHLLLINPGQFRNYCVFQQLNRSGFICLEPSATNAPSYDHLTSEHVPKKPSSNCSNPLSVISLKPHNQFDTILSSLKDILIELRQIGPQEQDLTSVIDSEDGCNLNITFEVYKREKFSKNKPHKGKHGSPDYRLIVCHKPSQKPPDSKQLASQYSDFRQSGTSESKLIIALVDVDNSICYTQFKPVNSLNSF